MKVSVLQHKRSVFPKNIVLNIFFAVNEYMTCIFLGFSVVIKELPYKCLWLFKGIDRNVCDGVLTLGKKSGHISVFKRKCAFRNIIEQTGI